MSACVFFMVNSAACLFSFSYSSGIFMPLDSVVNFVLAISRKNGFSAVSSISCYMRLWLSFVTCHTAYATNAKVLKISGGNDKHNKIYNMCTPMSYKCEQFTYNYSYSWPRALLIPAIRFASWSTLVASKQPNYFSNLIGYSNGLNFLQWNSSTSTGKSSSFTCGSCYKPWPYAAASQYSTTLSNDSIYMPTNFLTFTLHYSSSNSGKEDYFDGNWRCIISTSTSAASKIRNCIKGSYGNDAFYNANFLPA